MTDVTVVQVVEPGVTGPPGQTVAVVQDLGSISGAVAIDIAEGGVVLATIVDDVTFSFTGAYEDETQPAVVFNTTFMLVLINPGAGAITWPASVDWGNDGVPSLPAVGRARLAFATEDAGVSWDGVLSFLKSG